MIKELSEQSNVFPNESVKVWKDQGKKVIGFMCAYVPEEVIYAAGMLPFRIRGTGCTRMNRSDAVMSHYSCSFARSCLEFAMDGTYDFLDGLIAVDSCAQMHRLYDNWRFKAKLPFMHLLNLPHKNSAAAIAWYRDEIATLIRSMEKVFGVNITDENLVRAIEVYNETRMLLRSMYDLRKSENPTVTGSKSQSIVLAATSMPREQYNDLLKAYLGKIRSVEPIRGFRARLMLVGSSLDDPAFIKIIEDQGGLVVTDALCFGSRYFWEPVDKEGDLLLSLSKSLLSRPKCPRMMDEHVSLFAFIMDMVQNFNVDGIIFQKMQYCNLWGGESLFLEKKLKDAKIPFLSIEREQVLNNAAQIATRVEAFIEMIEGVIE
jgi:bzd-type benzoyl-CoA reductase N subunit